MEVIRRRCLSQSNSYKSVRLSIGTLPATGGTVYTMQLYSATLPLRLFSRHFVLVTLFAAGILLVVIPGAQGGSEWIWQLPVILSSLAAVMLTGLAVRRLLGPRPAFHAAVILAFSLLFHMFAETYVQRMTTTALIAGAITLPWLTLILRGMRQPFFARPWNRISAGIFISWAGITFFLWIAARTRTDFFILPAYPVFALFAAAQLQSRHGRSHRKPANFAPLPSQPERLRP